MGNLLANFVRIRTRSANSNKIGINNSYFGFQN